MEPSQSSGDQYSTIAALLRLSRCRAVFMVGQALAKAYHTDESWDEQLDKLSDSEDMAALAQVVADIRAVTENPNDPEEVARTVKAHYGRAVESVELVAEELGLDPRELLFILAAD